MKKVKCLMRASREEAMEKKSPMKTKSQRITKKKYKILITTAAKSQTAVKMGKVQMKKAKNQKKIFNREIRRKVLMKINSQTQKKRGQKRSMEMQAKVVRLLNRKMAKIQKAKTQMKVSKKNLKRNKPM